jgi:peroxiredoxin
MHARPLLLLFFSCLLTVACSLGEDVRRARGEDRRRRAGAGFPLQDLKSREVTLAGLRGRPVLLVFGTTWCPYCREEIPRIKEIYAKGSAKNLEVLNIYVNESQAKVGEFAARHALPYPVLLDRDGKVAARYQVRGVPMIVWLTGRAPSSATSAETSRRCWKP